MRGLTRASVRSDLYQAKNLMTNAMEKTGGEHGCREITDKEFDDLLVLNRNTRELLESIDRAVSED